MMMSESSCNEEKKTRKKNDNEWLFSLFCLWTFILLCRPQDIFVFLAPLRPALLTTAFFRGSSVFAERQVKLYSILLFIMVLGVPFSLFRRLSFEHVFTGYIIVAFYFFVFYKIVNTEKRLLTVLYIACFVTGMYSLFSVKMGSVVNGGLVFGSMFDANDMATLPRAFSL